MEDLLNFKETKQNHWHAEYDDLKFDIEKSGGAYALIIEGNDMHRDIHCDSLQDAQEQAKKFIVW